MNNKEIGGTKNNNSTQMQFSNYLSFNYARIVW